MPPSQIRSGPGLVRQYAFEGASTPGAGGQGGPEPEDDKAAADGSRDRWYETADGGVSPGAERCGALMGSIVTSASSNLTGNHPPRRGEK